MNWVKMNHRHMDYIFPLVCLSVQIETVEIWQNIFWGNLLYILYLKGGADELKLLRLLMTLNLIAFCWCMRNPCEVAHSA